MPSNVSIRVPESRHEVRQTKIDASYNVESVTTALTMEGKVLMAGEFRSEDLMDSHHQCIPRPVLGPLMDRVVVQVPCLSTL